MRNKIIFLLSLAMITCLHLIFFLYIKVDKKNIIEKKQVQQIHVSFGRIKQEKKTPKVEIKKEVIKKQSEVIFKKPIKKEAKREIKRKVKKKEIKKSKTKKIKEIKATKEIKEIKKGKNDKLTREVKKSTFEKKIVQSVDLELKKKVKLTYLQKLKIAIEENKRYPKISLRLNEEGKVYISFRISKSGLFSNIVLLNSSGFKRLDKSALEAVKKTRKFKPFPKELKKDFMDVDFYIKFKIKE